MQSKHSASQKSRSLLSLVVLIAAAAGTEYVFVRGKAAAGNTPPTMLDSGKTGGSAGAISVKIVTPRPGGINRPCTQPGSVEPFDAADSYSKVSGLRLGPGIRGEAAEFFSPLIDYVFGHDYFRGRARLSACRSLPCPFLQGAAMAH
jgi:hypothetical protein